MVRRTVRLAGSGVPPAGRVPPPPALACLRAENALLRRAVGGADPKRLAGSLLRVIDAVLPGCPCEVLVGDAVSGYLEVVGTRGFRPERGLGCRIPLGVGITGAAARRRRPVWAANVAADPRYIPGVARARWELAIPLACEGRVVGVVDLESAQDRPPSLAQRRYLAGLVAALAPAFARALPGERVSRLHPLPSPAPAPGGRPTPAALPAALVGHPLQVRYQPIVELAGRAVMGLEAEVGGPAGSPWESPARLLAAATDAVGAVALDLWRLRTALRDWPGGGRALFLDVHAVSLRRAGFLAAVQAALREHRHAPEGLVLELRGAGLHLDGLRRVAAALPPQGPRLAVDGFGAGSADVQALVDLQPAYIKLDAALIRSVDRDFGRRTYIESLGYYTARTPTRLIALGIATAEELACLRRCGVTYGQGDLLGEAAPRSV